MIYARFDDPLTTFVISHCAYILSQIPPYIRKCIFDNTQFAIRISNSRIQKYILYVSHGNLQDTSILHTALASREIYCGTFAYWDI